MQSTIDLELNIFAQRSVDKIEKRAEHQFQSLLIALLVERISLRANEIFWCEMHRAKRLNTCSESSAFDFHSRMKSTFLSFSRLPILYHRRREFDGWKSPLSRLSCCYSRRNTPLHHVFFLCKRKTLRHREIRENGSPVLTSQPTIPSFPTMRGFVSNRK